jgi:hypothetical protein
MLQEADAEAARVPGGANGSALGVVSSSGGGHTPQDTPGYSNLVFDNTLFETEVTACLCWVYCLWVFQLAVWMLCNMRASMSLCSVYGSRIDIQLGSLAFQQICMKQYSCVHTMLQLLQ